MMHMAPLPIDAVYVLHIMGLQHYIMEEFRDMPASFGADLPPDGLRGLLVVSDPEDGCEIPQKPPADDNFTGHWILLIARYNCSFEVKVRNAQMAGYDCAIVHNVNSSDLETMSAKDADDISIPSVFVNEMAGRILARKYQYNSSYYIMVNDDLPFNINTHLLIPFAIVVVLCLVIILIFMIVKCIKDRRRARRHRLPSGALKKIPTCKFSKGDPYDACAICLDDCQDGERLRVLPCAHAYHAVCIDPWLTQNKRVCPVCKRRVFGAGERRVLSDSDSDTEPLLAESGSGGGGGGGTFEAQTENPFQRSARFMARLRLLRRAPRPQEATTSPSEENADNEQSNEEVNNDENGNEHRALLPTVRAVSERRRDRRARSAQSARSAHSAHSAHSAQSAQSARSERSHQRARRPPDSHSINTDARGEIGVAALPAPHIDV